jgi:hypothetical protein
MKVDGIGMQSLGVPERPDGRVHRDRGGERFSIDGASGAERPGGDDPHPMYSDRVGGRRRQAARALRRNENVHGPKDHHAEETRLSEFSEFHFDLEPLESGDPDEGGGGEDEEGAAEERAAAAADFEALSAHLLRLGGPVREVTLYLPSLGQVTARLEAGAISIIVSVPRRLVGAVRRGEKELCQQMGALGLRIGHIQIMERDEPQELRRSEAPRHWSARGLVDVMA